MLVFRDLYLRGESDRVAAAIAEVEQSLTDGWSRDSLAEARLRSGGLFAYCFSCTKQANRPAATVFLVQKDADHFYVSNVVPEQLRLSYGEYNHILKEFCDRFLRACAVRAGLGVELTADQADLEDWLSPATADQLRRFSACANKGTGASHPSDRERWHDFVVAAHRQGSTFSAPLLRRWLIEVEGWAPEVADELAAEYENGRELLAFSEKVA